MSLFDSLGNGSPQQGQQITAQQAVAQLRADPAGALGQVGFNVPAGMDNPQQIVQHLMQSGQLPQNRFAQVMQMAVQMAGQMMGRR